MFIYFFPYLLVLDRPLSRKIKAMRRFRPRNVEETFFCAESICVFYFVEGAQRDAIVVLNWHVMLADTPAVVLRTHVRLVVGL
jgi:hypothetical protein